MKHYVTFSIFIVFSATSSLFAQNWASAQQWGGTGTETCSGLALASDGSVFMAGTFQNQIKFGEQTLTARGEADIFFCKLNQNGNVTWAKRVGSSQEDEVANIILDNLGNLIVIGTFWQQIDFENTSLNAKGNPKTIFVAKYNSEGQLNWAKSITGSNLKGITDVASDQDNNLIISGFFSDSLQIENQTLIAKGKTDLFIAKLNAAGNLQWVLHQGKTGDTRATALGVTNNGDLVVAGFFNDTTQIADTILTANTYDRDIFLTRIRKDGTLLWAKKAGGVFDSDVTALALDEADNIFLTGYFVGQIRLSEPLRIQSSTGNTDFFLLKYQSDGNPLEARALGGNLLQQVTDLDVKDNLLIISGFYQGDMILDGFSLFTPVNTVSGFVATFDPNFICQQALSLHSDNALFASRVAFDRDNAIITAGSFTGKATFDFQNFIANDSYDLFLAKTMGVTTRVANKKEPRLFQVFPNPTNGQVFIQTELQDFTIRVVNASGREVFVAKQQQELDFSKLPKGIYFLTFQTKFAAQTQKIIWH